MKDSTLRPQLNEGLNVETLKDSMLRPQLNEGLNVETPVK